MLPSEFTAILAGELNLAAVPVALENPAVLPARVVTTPAGVTNRIRWLPVSATTILLSGSTAIPRGKLKLADAPVASLDPGVVCPASVVTTPAPSVGIGGIDAAGKKVVFQLRFDAFESKKRPADIFMPSIVAFEA
jgi:hypothetical protein